MRVWTLNDYELPGSHARSLNLQRQFKARELTSEGQPENLVGRFWLFETTLNKPILSGDWTGLFASKPAPTVDGVQAVRDWSAVRPPSLSQSPHPLFTTQHDER
jgi:hypothetical protein